MTSESRWVSARAGLAGAWRDALRRPATTIAAAGMLALGIGLTTALFGAIDAVLLRPLPVVDADQVRVAWTRDVARGYAHFPFTGSAWDRLDGNLSTVEQMAAVDAWGWSELPVDGGDALRSARLARVLGDFFGLLGTRPALGRLTVPADALPGEAGSAVLSYAFWQRAFGGSAEVLGRTLRVGNRSLTVVGVAPTGFDYPRGAEIWTPMRRYEDARPQLEMDFVLRLRPGATAGQAEGEVATVLRSDSVLAETYADGTVIVTRPLREHLLGDVGSILLVLLTAAGLVLAIALANVANLLLVRGSGRTRQLSIRLALGADLRRLLGQLLAEGTVLAALGAAGGVVFAWLALHVLVPLAPGGTPGLDHAQIDPRALAFAGTLAALVALVCTVVPGLAAARLTPASVLSGGLGIAGGRPGRAVSRRVIGAVQIALAVAALVGAQMLVRTFAQLRELDLGFDPSSLQLVNLSAPYSVFDVPGSYLTALEAVAGRLAARPDVAAATPVLNAPLAESGVYAAPVLLEGQPTIADARDNPLLTIEVGLPDLFNTMGTRVLRGRTFDETDRTGAPPVVVVNETTARLLWPGGDAIGQRIRTPYPGHIGEVWTVAGVVEDTRYAALLEPRPVLYLPLLQFRSFAPVRLLVRTRGAAPNDLLPVTQSYFDELDPRTRALGSMGVAEILDRPLAGPRFAAIVLAIFALAAVVLAAAGVYAVMAATVRERTREFGIRMALGARSADVGRLVLRHGLLIAAAGAPAGLLVAVAALRRVDSLLFGVRAAEPAVLAAASLTILSVAVLACLAPARRAGRVDPADTLRVE